MSKVKRYPERAFKAFWLILVGAPLFIALLILIGVYLFGILPALLNGKENNVSLLPFARIVSLVVFFFGWMQCGVAAVLVSWRVYWKGSLKRAEFLFIAFFSGLFGWIFFMQLIERGIVPKGSLSTAIIHGLIGMLISFLLYPLLRRLAWEKPIGGGKGDED